MILKNNVLFITSASSLATIHLHFVVFDDNRSSFSLRRSVTSWQEALSEELDKRNPDVNPLKNGKKYSDLNAEERVSHSHIVLCIWLDFSLRWRVLMSLRIFSTGKVIGWDLSVPNLYVCVVITFANVFLRCVMSMQLLFCALRYQLQSFTTYASPKCELLNFPSSAKQIDESTTIQKWSGRKLRAFFRLRCLQAISSLRPLSLSLGRYLSRRRRLQLLYMSILCGATTSLTGS